MIPLSGLYKEDYDTKIVRKLILDKRIAPFYKGLADPPDDNVAESHTTSSPISISANKEPTSSANNTGKDKDGADETGTRANTWTSTVGSNALASQSLARNASSPSNSNRASENDNAAFSNNHATVKHLSPSASSLAIVSDLRKNKRSSSFSTPGQSNNIVATPNSNGNYELGSGSPPLEELYASAIECPICFLVSVNLENALTPWLTVWNNQC